MAGINLLVAVPLRASVRYREELKKQPNFNVNLVANIEDARTKLKAEGRSIGVLIVDNALGDVYELIKELRQKYPHLLIIEVDEEADFSLPGQADDVSNNPFENDELVKKVKTLVEDRRLETLRADSLPSVRTVAKALMQAKGSRAKTKAAVDAIAGLGYEYVAFFKITPTDPPSVSVVIQHGPSEITRMAPSKLSYDKSVAGYVAQTGQSKIFIKDDEYNHPFVMRGKYKQGVCVPVGNNIRFGVLLALQNEEDNIPKESVLQMELVSAQLASALARESSA